MNHKLILMNIEFKVKVYLNDKIVMKSVPKLQIRPISWQGDFTLFDFYQVYRLNHSLIKFNEFISDA